MAALERHIIIVGATASGKSEVAIKVAQKFDPIPEIISLDSMQIYKGMEIGTGVVPLSEQKGIKHHLIGTIAPTQDYSVKEFQTSVYEILENSPERKYVLVGGTGLYTHAIVDGFDFAPTNQKSREEIIKKFDLDETNPNPEKVSVAYSILNDLDPQAASKIDPLNVRRIVRALEAIEISKIKFSEIGEGVQAFGEPKFDVSIVGLMFSRDTLRERILKRIEKMFDEGWIEEVKNLMPIWGGMKAPPKNAIGYGLIVDWIKNGEKSPEFLDLKEKIVNKTAQFSRRQRKWFERDPRIKWIDCESLEIDEIVDRVIEFSGTNPVFEKVDENSNAG